MTEVQTNLAKGVAQASISPEQFRRLPETESECIYRNALTRFVVGTSSDPVRWWEFLARPVAHWSPHPLKFEHTLEVVPTPDAPVVFMPQDDESGFLPAYLTSARVAVRVLNASHAPEEFYLFPEDLAWLLCLNHHDTFFAIGEPVFSVVSSLGGISHSTRLPSSDRGTA